MAHIDTRAIGAAGEASGSRRLSALGLAATIHVIALVTLTWLASAPPMPGVGPLDRSMGGATIERPIGRGAPRAVRRLTTPSGRATSSTSPAQSGRVASSKMARVLSAVNTAALTVAVKVGLVDPRSLDVQPLPESASQIVFEAVTIKPNSAGRTAPSRIDVEPGGRFIAENVRLAVLVGGAYQLRSSQFFGAPRWIWSDTFDIQATAWDELLPNDAWHPLRGALRALLADRFAFTAHIEMKRLPP